MKIAIPAEKNDINSLIDNRFGRCEFFFIYDTDSKKGAFFLNNFKNSNQGAGTQSSEFLAEHKVEKLFTVELGNKAENLINSLGIKVEIVNSGASISSIINKLN